MLVLLISFLADAATTTGHGFVSITNEATTDVSFAVTGIAAQTANFVTIQNSGATDIFTVDVSGNVVSATNSYTSDRRWKRNLANLTYGLDTVARLEPVSFDWVDSHPSAGTGPQLGFIAQDVEDVVPEVVRTDANGYKSIIYDRFAVIAIKAIQDLNAVVQAQAATIQRLEDTLTNLN